VDPGARFNAIGRILALKHGMSVTLWTSLGNSHVQAIGLVQPCLTSHSASWNQLDGFLRRPDGHRGRARVLKPDGALFVSKFDKHVTMPRAVWSRVWRAGGVMFLESLAHVGRQAHIEAVCARLHRYAASAPQTRVSWNRLTHWLRLVSTLAAGAPPKA
jgi:hypothetical protein